MTKRMNTILAIAAGLSILVSGCADPKAAPAPGTPEQKVSEASDTQKISQGVTLQRMLKQKMLMEHNQEKFQGVEYTFQFQLPAEITDEKTLDRIKIEVTFSGRTKEIMSVDRFMKPLQLQKAESSYKEYIIRIPSVYRADYSEEELNDLIDQAGEVHVSLYLDEQRVRDLI